MKKENNPSISLFYSLPRKEFHHPCRDGVMEFIAVDIGLQTGPTRGANTMRWTGIYTYTYSQFRMDSSPTMDVFGRWVETRTAEGNSSM